MLKDLNDIKKTRKRIGLTQAELADRAGVSQSLVAKIENETTEPSYTKGKKILATLESMVTSESIDSKAEDVHSTGIYTVKPTDTLGEALDKMHEHAISQLPVIEDDTSVGAVTERCLLKDLDTLDKEVPIKKFMSVSLPIVDKDTELTLVKEMLKYYPSVLTAKNGSIVGMITKADLLDEI